MDLTELIHIASVTEIVSEADVRTKVAVPLFRALGWDDRHRADEFPIYAFAGRQALPPKPADLLFFDSPDHPAHRNRDDRRWVQDHALVVTELKRPAVPMDARGQAEFYAQWSRTPFYVITNGRELAIYRVAPFQGDALEFQCRIEDLAARWPEIERLLRPEAVLAYCRANALKVTGRSATNYGTYATKLVRDLDRQLPHAIARTVSSQATLATPGLPFALGGRPDAASLERARLDQLLAEDSPLLVLAGTGAGKTWLLQQLASVALRTGETTGQPLVPVILPAKAWGQSFSSLAEGIREQVAPYVPGITEAIVTADLRQGVFLLLIDGLDEIEEGGDSLCRELLRVARDGDSRLIVTCRSDNYYGELDERFNSWRIDSLTDDQIKAYATAVLGETGEYFLYRIGPALRELVRNPMFLFMTTAVLAENPAALLPTNRAKLYQTYTGYLLTHWARRRPSPVRSRVDQRTQERVLAAYARTAFRRVPDEHAFLEVVQSQVGSQDVEVVSAALIGSGLLQRRLGGVEFAHQSFEEYFLAYGLADADDAALSDFITTRHADKSYEEVFAFLAGLLPERRRQALLLDYLEEHNLGLSRRCLEARRNLADQLERELPRGFVSDYLVQLRSSYRRIVAANLAPVKALVPPWRGIEDMEAAARSGLAISGSLEADGATLSYRLQAIPPDQPDATAVKVLPAVPRPTIVAQTPGGPRALTSISSMVDGRGYGFYDLRQGGLGIDSAREIAHEQVRHAVKRLLDDGLPPWLESHALGCEMISREFARLSSLDRLWRSSHPQGLVPSELVGLSLQQPIDDLVAVLQRYRRVTGIRMPAGHVIALPIASLLARLRELRAAGLTAEPFVLPGPDRAWRDVPASERAGAWGRWSDECFRSRVGRFYDFFQDSYRQLVDQCFPALRDQLYFYSVGPVRFHAHIHNWRRDEPRPFVRLRWEPVVGGTSTTTIVEFDGREDGPTDDERRADTTRIRDSLRALDRPVKLRRIGKAYHLWDYTQEDALRREVYFQLTEDFKTLLGRF